MIGDRISALAEGRILRDLGRIREIPDRGNGGRPECAEIDEGRRVFDGRVQIPRRFELAVEKTADPVERAAARGGGSQFLAELPGGIGLRALDGTGTARQIEPDGARLR